MSRYVPSPEEQAAVDLLRLAGYAVVRQRTYDDLREKVTKAQWEVQWQTEWREHSDAWARRECGEQRRLQDRLTEVCAAAVSQGVTLDAINAALHPPDQRAEQ